MVSLPSLYLAFCWHPKDKQAQKTAQTLQAARFYAKIPFGKVSTRVSLLKMGTRRPTFLTETAW